MSRLLLTLLGLAVTAAIAMGFGFAFTLWHGLGGELRSSVLFLYAAATAFTLVGFLTGQAMGLRSLVFYMVMAAAIFLGVDLVVWLAHGIMPSVKFLRGGFVPAAVMGLFLGPLYRIIAVPTSAMHRGDR